MIMPSQDHRSSLQGVAGIIENYDGNFILHLRDAQAPTMSGQWCLIGGAVEADETPEEAMAREIKEETNLKIQVPVFFKNFIFNEKAIYIYHCKVDTRQDKLILGEGADIRFFGKDELLIMLEKMDNKNLYLEALMKFFTKERLEPIE